MTTIRPITFRKLINDILIGGCSLTELANAYGTPLYVLDEKTIRQNCQIFTKILTEHYPNFTIAYASKAGLNIGIANLLASEGVGADVVSGGELYTVLKSHIDPTNVYFHGNNKSIQELNLAIEHDIRLVVDNEFEIQLIESIASQLNKKAKIMFRIKPGIEAHTHEYIKTGHIDSKFGVNFEESLSLIERIHGSTWGEFIGIHAHIGSQIFDIDPYRDLVEILADFMDKINEQLGIHVPELNCGGGFGVNYIENHKAPNISDIILSMANEIKLFCEGKNRPYPKLIFEPGRSIIANAGVTIYTAGASKAISDGQQYLFIDGGMADNPRPMMYNSEYTFDAISPTNPNKATYTIAGKFCESGDILAKSIRLPIVKPMERIVVYGTGAYNYSMASNYNRFCKPAMVLVNDAQASLLIHRETYEDIIRYDAQ